jgi:hypothetical protein
LVIGCLVSLWLSFSSVEWTSAHVASPFNQYWPLLYRSGVRMAFL